MIQFHAVQLALGDKTIFNDLSFTIPPQAKIILTGKSGTGKTALLKLLLGFIKPDKGSLEVDGQELSAKTIWTIRRQMAYVDQEVQLGQTTFEQLLASCFNYSFNCNRTLNQNKYYELLDYLELPAHITEKNIPELSGGERQRLGIILALLLERKIILLDEVTSALDKSLKNKVVQLFEGQSEQTILAIGHDSVWQDSTIFESIVMEDQPWL